MFDPIRPGVQRVDGRDLLAVDEDIEVRTVGAAQLNRQARSRKARLDVHPGPVETRCRRICQIHAAVKLDRPPRAAGVRR